jgi:hypothetical protein
VANNQSYVLSGQVGVGANGLLLIGAESEQKLYEAEVQIRKYNREAIAKDDAISALVVDKAFQMAQGSVLVVGSEVDTAGLNGNLVFGKDSTLFVSTQAATANNGAISATTEVGALIKEGAKLVVDGPINGKFTILGGKIQVEAEAGAWSGENLISTVDTDTLIGSIIDGRFVVDPRANTARLTGLDGDLVAILDGMTLDETSGKGGVRFLSRAPRRLAGTQAAKTIESAARIAALGGVPQVTKLASDAAAAAVIQRISQRAPDAGMMVQHGDGSVERAANARDNGGFALWISPLYQSQHAWGMEAGNFDIGWGGGLGGLAMGADYTFDSMFRAGVNFSIGGGYLKSTGDLSDTTNRFNFWGVGAYGGWFGDNFALMADVNFTSTFNDIEQDVASEMEMANLKSDIQGYAVSAGVRGEYKIKTKDIDITPHVDAQFMYFTTDTFEVMSKGTTILRGTNVDNYVWSFPVGITVSKEIPMDNGWYVKPSLDFTVIPSIGDIYAKSVVRFMGMRSQAYMNTRFMDYVTYQGSMGIAFGNENITFGLNYVVQMSGHMMSQGVYAVFCYEF